MEDEIENLKEMKLPWHRRLMMRVWPWGFLRSSAEEMGIEGKKIDYAYKLFEDSKIHIEPLLGSNRGFIITLDDKLALWFFQDGKSFKFDGVEMGEYEAGDVTVFDGIKNKKQE